MIQSRKDLKEYLRADAKNYKVKFGIKGFFISLICSPVSDQKYIWKYIKAMRYAEYYINKYHSYKTPFALYYLYKLRKYGRTTGLQIHPYTFGKGLAIWHYGTVIINATAKIGERCTIRPDILVGHKNPGEKAARIGNDVFIHSGVRIIGAITIGDDVIIGPNAVVTKDIPSHSVVVGIPGRIIKTRESIDGEWIDIK